MGLLLAYLLTLLLTHCSQYLLPKNLRPSNGNWRLQILQAAVITTIYLTALMLSLRPYLAVVITLALLTVLLVINQAKYRALREPLVFSDIYLYLQVVRHPRLFLPFLNIPLVAGSVFTGLCILYFAIRLETPLFTTEYAHLVLFYPAIILLAGLSAYTAFTLSHQVKLAFEPDQDVRKFGFYNSLVIYTVQASDKAQQTQLKHLLEKQSPFKTHKTDTLSPRSNLTDIVVVQSESFFDPRPLCPAIKPEIMEHFDHICAESTLHGSLNVPAWGANTLRTEFAFLSGIDNRRLKHYRFNPYQYLRDEPVPTLASHLKSLGYRCIAIHPNDSGFFGRNKVFPLLGFDEFIDITEFNAKDTDGPYISDAAVAKKINGIIDNQPATQPLFIFAITMENHGPLHLESMQQQDISHFYQGNIPVHHHDLSVYLRHLQNANSVLKEQITQLKASKRKTLLGFYGDHVPSMPDIYREFSFQGTKTVFFAWQQHPHKPKGI